MTAPYILAIDPGSKSSGWAVARSRNALASGAIRASTLWLMAERIDEWCHEDITGIVGTEPVILVVERTPVTSRVPRDFYMPGVAAGLWVSAWQRYIADSPREGPHLVRAGDWQRPMLGRRPTKSLSMIRARLELEHLGRDASCSDEADAVNLAVWASGKVWR
jgi:hypothetical protein